MGQNIEQIMLRRIGGSLYFRIPPAFIRKHDLSSGDCFFWLADENGAGARIKAVRAEKPDMAPPATEDDLQGMEAAE